MPVAMRWRGMLVLPIVGMVLAPPSALAGWPEGHVQVQVEKPCPVGPSRSGVGLGDGSLTLDFPFVLVPQAPGPVVFSLQYASGADNPGTYGTRLNLRVRTEKRTDACPGFSPASDFVPRAVDAAEVNFNTSPGDQRAVGFGVRKSNNGGSSEACNVSRSSEMPFPSSNLVRGGGLPSDWCPGGPVGGHGCVSDMEAVVTLPLRLSDPGDPGAQMAYQRKAPGQPDCPPPVPNEFPADRGVYSINAGATLRFDSPAYSRNDYSHDDRQSDDPCEQFLYLEKRPDETIARLGVNWTHSFAWSLTEYSVGTRQFVAVRSPRGSVSLYERPAGLALNQELPLRPSAGCSCQSARLFWTRRSFAPPGIGVSFFAYELVAEDASRMVFTEFSVFEGGQLRAPAGRLVRLEDNDGQSPIALTYDTNGDLARVYDAAGFHVELQYAETPSGRRLERLVLPGGRQVSLGWLAGKLASLRDPVHVAQNLPGYTFAYGTGLSSEDITCRTSPDGEIHRYTYITDPADPNAGRLKTAEIVDSCEATESKNTLTYTYSRPDSVDGERWVKITPHLVTTAPIIKNVLNADGHLIRTEEICAETSAEAVARSCPVVPEISPHPVVAMVSSTSYDEFGQARAVRTYPVVLPPYDPSDPPSPTSLDATHFSVSCVTRDASQGKPITLFGSTCIDTSTVPPTAVDGWTDEACDCDLAQLNAAPVPTVAPIGTQVSWEFDVQGAGPTPILVTYDRPRRVIAPSQRTDPGQGAPGASAKGVRIFYYETVGYPIRSHISDICPPEVDSPEPGLGCEHFEYNFYTIHGGDVVQLASRTDGSGNTWTYEYDPLTHLLSRITAPSSDGQQFVTNFQYGTDGLLNYVEAPGGLVTAFLRNERGQIAIESRPGAAPPERMQVRYTYTPGGKLRRIADESRESQSSPGKYVAWWISYGGPAVFSDWGAEPAQFERLPRALRRGPATLGGPFATIDADELQPDELAGTVYESWDYDSNLQPVATYYGPPFTFRRALVTKRDGFGAALDLVIMGQGDSPAFLERTCIESDPRTGLPRSVSFSLAPPDEDDLNCPLTNGAMRHSFTYDRAGRASSTSMQWDFGAEGAGLHQTCRQHDPWGRLTQVVDEVTLAPTPGCDPISAFRTTDVAHDDADRPWLVTLSNAGLPYADYQVEYDNNQRAFKWTEAQSREYLAMSYRPDGLLTNITRGRPHSGGSSWLDTKFTQDLRYDARGFVMRLEQHRLPYLWPSGDTTWFYTHDDAGRLTGAALDPVDWPSLPNIVDESYAYLPSNPWNLASITDNLTSTTTAFPTDDEDRIQTPDREYHAFIGALKRENGAGGQTRRYRWDVAGRLMAVLEGTDATGYAGTAYSYDPWNRLVAERPITTATATGQPVSAGSPTIHLWSGWQQVGEVESFASAPAFAWSDGPMGLAGIKREGSSHERLFSDAQGSVKYGFADDPVYTPFGKVVSGTLSTAKGFQGQEWRDEARLYYMRHRWYDPASARFLSRDPVRTGAIHNFAFAMDSPVMMGDPMGLDTFVLIAHAGGGGDKKGSFGHAALVTWDETGAGGFVDHMGQNSMWDPSPSISIPHADRVSRFVSNYVRGNHRDVSIFELDLSAEVEAALRNAISARAGAPEPKRLFTNNCTDVVTDVLHQAGVSERVRILGPFPLFLFTMRVPLGGGHGISWPDRLHSSLLKAPFTRSYTRIEAQ